MKPLETKICTLCGNPRLLTEYWADNSKKDGLKYRCKDCERKRTRNNRHYIENKDLYRDRAIKSLYGISLVEYIELAKSQEYKCYICKLDCSERKFCLDHNHETGKIRKFLCNKCNMLVGVVEDDELLLAVTKYIKEQN